MLATLVVTSLLTFKVVLSFLASSRRLKSKIRSQYRILWNYTKVELPKVRILKTLLLKINIASNERY